MNNVPESLRKGALYKHNTSRTMYENIVKLRILIQLYLQLLSFDPTVLSRFIEISRHTGRHHSLHSTRPFLPYMVGNSPSPGEGGANKSPNLQVLSANVLFIERNKNI